MSEYNNNPFEPLDTLETRIYDRLERWWMEPARATEYDRTVVDVYDLHNTSQEVIRDVLALVRDALLSDAAVEAAARVEFSDDYLGTELWSDMPDDLRDLYISGNRNALTAALNSITENTDAND